jgi:hypothetical protein
LIQTGHLNLGGQHAFPQPQVPPNVILQPHPSIVNVLESHVQPHNDGWGGIPVNPSSGANQWPIDPPPPPVHTVATNASFPLSLVHPTLPVQIVLATTTNASMPSPPPPKYHKTTPHGSQVDKGKKPITSTNMAKSSSSAHSKIKSVSSGKISLSDLHPEVSQLEEKKSQYEDFIREREEFFKKKFPGLF